MCGYIGISHCNQNQPYQPTYKYLKHLLIYIPYGLLDATIGASVIVAATISVIELMNKDESEAHSVLEL